MSANYAWNWWEGRDMGDTLFLALRDFRIHPRPENLAYRVWQVTEPAPTAEDLYFLRQQIEDIRATRPWTEESVAAWRPYEADDEEEIEEA